MVESKPRVISEEETRDTSLAIGLCPCPKPINYGHVFKKTDYPGGCIRFRCTECGTVGRIYFMSNRGADR